MPVWQCEDCSEYTVSETDATACSSCGSKKITQETDVLDTWFSSALWPFSTLGWPEDTEALKTFYPTDILVTGPDIIFFWVARMMMQGLEYQKDVPFRKVYLNGLIRDSQGRKMSKSLGNSIDPVELIENFGADALRFTLMSQMASGKDIKFSMQRLEGYRNFMNKIWNATRFCLTLVSDNNFKYDQDKFLKSRFNTFDIWILSRMKETVESVNLKLKDLRFSEAAQDLYSFVWNDFCDWYLEFSKIRVYGEDEEEKETALGVLCFCLDNIIKLLHPFVPFATEEIYSNLPTKNQESLALSDYPSADTFKDITIEEDQIMDADVVRACITAVRNIKGENQIKVSQPVKAYLIPRDDKTQIALQKQKALISKMALIEGLSLEDPESLMNCAVTPIKLKGRSAEVVVPLEGRVDIAEEINRINKIMTKIEADLNQVSGKLSNERYLQNAPEELVEADKKQVLVFQGKLKFLTDHLSRLNV
jgi:valyl-tRNA synthetase